MDNQHRQIKGYRELDQATIDLMNEVKAAGQSLAELLDRVKARIDAQYRDGTSAETGTLDAAEARRWHAMARTDLQTGLMKLTRAVAQPEFF